MPTVINNPSGTEDSGSNLVVGVLLTIVILGAVVLFFVYGLPAIKNSSNQNPNGTNINVTVPGNQNPAPAPQNGY